MSMIIHEVQDPRAFCVLTRHGRAVAAIVSMAELDRIVESQDIEDVIAGIHRPASFYFGQVSGIWCNKQAAEMVHKIQMDRRTEREVLANAGLEPIPGGEVVGEIEVVKEKKVGWWRRWWG